MKKYLLNAVAKFFQGLTWLFKKIADGCAVVAVALAALADDDMKL